MSIFHFVAVILQTLFVRYAKVAQSLVPHAYELRHILLLVSVFKDAPEPKLFLFFILDQKQQAKGHLARLVHELLE